MRPGLRRFLALPLFLSFLVAAPAGLEAAERSARPAQKARSLKARAYKARRAARPADLGVTVGPETNPLSRLPRPSGERFVVGVMGGAGANTPKRVQEMSHEVGVEIARAGHVTLTGAAPGLPDDAARGAKSAGGLTIGISPHRTLEDHVAAGAPTNFDVLQLTSLPAAHKGQTRPNYMGREIDNIEHSDAILVVGGRFGTLGELAIALEEGRPVGILEGSGGIADEARRIVAASTRAGKPPQAPVLYDHDPKRLVTRLLSATRQAHQNGNLHGGPIGDR